MPTLGSKGDTNVVRYKPNGEHRWRVATITLAMIILTDHLALRCSAATKGWEIKTNAGQCRIAVVKMKDGNVRFSIENVLGPSVVIQRNGDRWGSLSLEVRNRIGMWSELDSVNPFVEQDWGAPADSQWTYLAAGDEYSFYLVYNFAGRLKAGDEVRLHWATSGPIPSYYSEYGHTFPKAPLVVQLTVQAEGAT